MILIQIYVWIIPIKTMQENEILKVIIFSNSLYENEMIITGKSIEFTSNIIEEFHKKISPIVYHTNKRDRDLE